MGKQKTTEQFIKEAIAKHGDKYDYSKVVYNKKDDKVIIICKKHKEFEQCANSHLQGCGCKKCATEETHTLQKSNTINFIEKSKQIHGDKYDYSNVDYINVKTKIIIVCNSCKISFSQVPNTHLCGHGCRKCANKLSSDKKRIHTTESIVQKAKEIHGDKYEYSNVEYTGIDNKIIIICKEHGEFEQSPDCHINRQNGCGKCGVIKRAKNKMISPDEIIKKAKDTHGNKYDYSKVEYHGIYNKIIIICKEHGEFEQSANSHIRGSGCTECVRNIWTTDKFIEKSKEKHGDKYDYSKVEYSGCDTNVIILCKKHNAFNQTPYNHLNGQGCSFCVNKTEGKLYEKIQLLYPTIVTQFKQEWCKKIKNLPFDFCIKEYNVIIELDGAQHFQQISNWSSPEEQFENDKYKEKCANDNGYSVIRILQEDVFYDTYDWLKELCETIEEIKNVNEIVNFYLCKNGEYDKYYDGVLNIQRCKT
jgi:very-short-patch-repair endonuclease